MNLLALFTAVLCFIISTASPAADLVPHEAVYDLKLVEKSQDLQDGEARIVSRLERAACNQFDIEFRYVAKLVREDRTIVTDQQSDTMENWAAGTYKFTTKTFVDGLPESVIQGDATSTAGGTKVQLSQPAPQSFDLPLSVFPTAHTADLIDRALKGETRVVTRLYDGDNEADKNLTTTVLIMPAENQAGPRIDASPKAAGLLASLKRWRVNESYYNDDMLMDGLPLFRMSYVLYENGVTDQLVMDTGDYAFAGSLSKLTLAQLPSCDNEGG